MLLTSIGLTFPAEWWWCNETPKRMVVMEWKAVAAILDFIWPLLGKGLEFLKLPRAAAADTRPMLRFIITLGSER